jgi:hypothetical protein
MDDGRDDGSLMASLLYSGRVLWVGRVPIYHISGNGPCAQKTVVGRKGRCTNLNSGEETA